MTARAQIVLVDDHPLFRQGLREVLSRESDLDVIADVGLAAEAVQVAASRIFDVAVIDLVLPNTNGVALTTELKRLRPSCKVLGLSMLDEPTRIAEMIRAGADGFALKSQPPSEIVEAIRTVVSGTRYLPPTSSREQIHALIDSDDAWPLRRLTAREREIFDLLVSGRSNDDIASQLFIAKRTVETHRQHIMKKVGARSLVELIRIGMKHGVDTTVA
ncbi:MAG: response regulator receiver, LuxR family [Myxococcales bacterium]|nr:response regulator receiver, LuxR family [Myxococcales bacterium]